MIETRENLGVGKGVKVTLKDGDYECSYILLHIVDMQNEEAMYRTPAKQTIERMKAQDVGAFGRN